MKPFFHSEPKRKTPSISSGVSGEPTRKKKRPSSPKEILVTRDEALLSIRKDWTIIKNKHLKDKPYQVYLQDRTFVKKIIGMSYTTLKWLPQFKDDKELVHDAILTGEEMEDEVPIHPSAIQFASDRLKNDVEFIKELRVFMKGESNALSLLAKFDSLIPDSVLVQIEPISKYFLDRSIEGGKYELFLQQKSILPKQRQSYLKRIIQITSHRTITGDGTYRMYIGPEYLAQYEKIFSKLIEGDYGKRSLKRICVSPHWSDKFTKWMTSVVSDELYLKLVQELRLDLNFSKLVIKELVSELTTDSFYIYKVFADGDNRDIVQHKINKYYTAKKSRNFMNRVINILHLSTTGTALFLEMTHIFNFVSNFGNAIRLDFSDSAVSNSRNNSLKADNIIYTILILLKRSGFINSCWRKWFRRCISDGYLSSTQFLRKHFFNGSSGLPPSEVPEFLFLAITSGHLEIVKVLQHTCPFNTRYGNDNYTTVIAASNNVDITRFLLIRNRGILNATDSRGYTALAKAVAYNNLEVVKFLLQLKANPNIANRHGRTPLFKAVSKDIKIFRELLNPIHSANVNHRDENGNTILHSLAASAVWHPNVELKFQMLLGLGADINSNNANGQTPLFYCKITEVYNMFTSNGGGGIVSLNRFRSDINVSALTSNVVLKHQEDMMVEMSNHTTMPVRCLPCKHVFNGKFLYRWVNENKFGYEGSSHFKDTCPNCRQKIRQVEIMSIVAAANWDDNESKAKEEENGKKTKMDEVKHKTIYRQLVVDFNQKKREYEEIKRKKEEEEERVRTLRKNISNTANATAKHFRDLRLVSRLEKLKL